MLPERKQLQDEGGGGDSGGGGAGEAIERWLLMACVQLSDPQPRHDLRCLLRAGEIYIYIYIYTATPSSPGGHAETQVYIYIHRLSITMHEFQLT